MIDDDDENVYVTQAVVHGECEEGQFKCATLGFMVEAQNKSPLSTFFSIYTLS